MKINRGGVAPVRRKASEIDISTFTGLNTTAPYTQLDKGDSPYFNNVRLYARNSTDRRIAVGTRKGPAFYSVPLGETQDQTQTSTTGEASQAVSVTTWVGAKFTAGATGRLTKAEVRVNVADSPTQHLLVCIYSDNSGSPGSLLATSSVLLEDATVSYAYETVRFIEAPAVTSGTAYWVVLKQQAGGTGNWNWASTTNAATGKTSTNSGGTWSASSVDYNFRTFVSTSGKHAGGFQYTPTSGTNKVVIAQAGSVYSVDTSTGVTTAIATGLSANATDYYFGQADDKLYFVNGYDTPQVYDGASTTAVGGAVPISKFIQFHKNRMFVVDANNTTKLQYSELGDYGEWLSTSFIYVPSPKSGDPITGLTVFQDNLIIFTRKTKYVLYGEDPGNFVLRQSSGKKGAINQAVIASDPNFIYYLADDGVWRYNGSADQLVSDAIQNEIDQINDKTKCSAVIHDNYYRLYYPTLTSGFTNGTLLFDSTNKLWLRDTDTYIHRPFILEDNTLIEGSSLVGALYASGQDYSDMGKPIDFKYWTNYFGNGINKVLLRRVIPSIRLQTSPYQLSVLIDIDQRNTVPIQYTIDAQAVGTTWGAGDTWGSGQTWGSATVSSPRPMAGTEAFWHQVRFEQSGVNTPVEILSILLQIRQRRTE